MKKFLKKHMGLVITLIIILAFPASLSTQARLNMRNIITGLAIDKNGDEYEVTAQVVKPVPNSSSAGTGAIINLVSDTGDSIISALSKLSYKTGKVAGFSHTNFVLIGKDVLQEDLTQTLDYFVRDNTIKDSALMLVAKDKAKDEIKKTKDIELSVGLGLQKVFLYKEKEGDATMVSLLSFMNKSKGTSKSLVLSTLSLKGEDDKQQKEKQGEETGGGESSSETQPKEELYFESLTPLCCFVGGKYVGSLENEDEIEGYMLSEGEVETEDVLVKEMTFGKFKNADIGVKVKKKNNKIKIRYEQDTPCLDLYVDVKNSEIREIKNNEIIYEITKEEFENLKNEIKNVIAQKISKTFVKSKELGADIFGAYDLAYKFHYKKTKNLFNSMEEFLEKLKLNVIVSVSRLEY